MTEILTESFCERCGTRYTFEPVQSKRRGLGKIGTLGRGFRHFVADPGSSLDEAFAVAKSETEQRATTHALEAFHRTFNFCLNCRQYTCGDCWNAVEGRCLSCAPTGEALEPPQTRMDTAVALPPLDAAPSRVPLELEEDRDLRNAGPWIGAPAEPAPEPAPEAPSEALELPPLPGLEARPEVEAAAPVETAPAAEPLPDLDALPALGALPEAQPLPEVETAQELEPEPLADLVSAEAIDARLAVPPTDDAITGILDEPAVAASEVPVAEPESLDAVLDQQTPDAAPEPIEAAAEPIEAEAEPAAAAEPAPRPAEAASADAGLAFEPGLNLDDQIAEYERQIAAVQDEPEAAPQPIAAAPEPIAAQSVPEPEPVAAQAEPQPEPVATHPEPAPEPVAAPAEPERVAAAPEPEPVAAAAEPEPAAAPEPEPVAAAAESEPAAAPEPEPVAAAPEPEPVAAEAEPAAAPAPAAPEPSQELPVAASTAAPPPRIEPIPTAIGTPLPASVVDGPLAWPNSDLAAAAFEQQWPDIPVPRRPAPETPPATQAQPAPETAQPVLPPVPPAAAVRRTGANLPSVSAPPPVLTARACPSCGLSLSASARFCRRCGTPQQVDAAR